MFKHLLVAATMMLPIASYAQTTVQAIRASDFVNSLGVNTHLGWGNSSYTNTATVQKAIAYLGVRHVRDSIPFGTMVASMKMLHDQNGVTFDVVSHSAPLDLAADISGLMWMVQNAPGVIDGFEGPNEFNANDDHAPGILGGANSRNNFPWGPAANAYYYAGLRSHTALGGIRYVGVTTSNASTAQAASMGDMSAHVDVSSWHTYFNNGEQPYGHLARGYSNAHATAPSRPMWYTETGCTSSSETAYTWCGNAPADAKLMLNVMADAVHVGGGRAYVYELLNNRLGTPALTDTEGGFGLFDGSGSPKHQAVALHNLMSILADSGSNFTPTSINYSVSNLPSGAQSMALQKSSGDTYLMFWAEPTGGVIPSTVTVTLSARHALSVYDPLFGADPAGNTVTADHISLAVSDHPVLVRIGAAVM